MTSANTRNTNADNSGKANKARKAAALGLAVMGIAGLAAASAAQLNMDTGNMGAGTTVVAACQPEGTPISVGFESSFADGEYKATGLNLTSIDPACSGQDYKVTLTDGEGNPVGAEATGTVSGTSVHVPLTGASAENIEGVAVTIHK